MNIGKSVVIKGELTGSEDLTIEGHVEGKIELRQNVLTIGPNGKIKAQVFAKSVMILGEVTGNVTASEKVDLRDNGSVDGDIAAPRVAIAEGAHFRGSIDMQRAARSRARPKPASRAGVHAGAVAAAASARRRAAARYRGSAVPSRFSSSPDSSAGLGDCEPTRSHQESRTNPEPAPVRRVHFRSPEIRREASGGAPAGRRGGRARAQGAGAGHRRRRRCRSSSARSRTTRRPSSSTSVR